MKRRPRILLVHVHVHVHVEYSCVAQRPGTETESRREKKAAHTMSVDISDAGAKASVSVFVRSKSGPSPAGKMVHVSATSKAADDPHLKCAPINHLARFSANGSVLGAVEADGVRVLRADGSGAVALSLPRPQVQELWLSPKGTFLLTWEKMAPTEGGEGEGNLKIWRVATGELVCSQKPIYVRASLLRRPWAGYCALPRTHHTDCGADRQQP